jgi:excinuclease ABC subunit B
LDPGAAGTQYSMPDSRINMVADPVVAYMDKGGIEKMIVRTEKDMMRAAKEMEFMEAARLRDELDMLRNRLKEL